ncbi:2Fe-2S iron-sulfur cluster binding domain-containing protein [Providencia rettgeri]|uniref:2Fe-2S iron-sulfur cluster-binding protein n=1 Tax=Providencia TaxID=586 RepID=UPI001419E97C|nr:2Fe-2S iron-sulfur cluster binding domain-containing protein [Providencia rettgeri]ELR5225042.1 2Fe-2S iron-sulfur cluster binding domain-containing protein [Providencia rettgeri]NIA73299.1 2Fe-2S iron-sulfur cluster binding domain-containing protein [Providencia rettgeri]NIA79913.1 2Fe-2S iron-sulfur cluster binding domain-containing protein [Providencia rettgeri]NIB03133.1 2Fe-2S iron-sulfur cluster binding domain-containing protein [Providencia rettgeri]NIB07301.1 2Fe-2S iron-sulfur clus
MSKAPYHLIIGNNNFTIMSNETILECAYKNGVKIKYHCAAGHCGKCKVKLISGEVKLDHSGGISKEDIANGFILTCCSFAKGDIQI